MPDTEEKEKQIIATLEELEKNGILTEDKKIQELLGEIFKHVPGDLITRLFQLYTNKKLDSLNEKSQKPKN